MNNPEHNDELEHEAEAEAEAEDSSEAYQEGIDWRELYFRLGESDEADMETRVRQRLRDAFVAVLDWVFEGVSAETKIPEKLLARRIAALAWVLRPSYLDDSPTLRKLASAFGVEAPQLAKHTVAASHRFGITNNQQKHGWNRKQ